MTLSYSTWFCTFIKFVIFQHIEKVFKHKELELQLVDAKLAQANLMMTEEKEHNIREKKQVHYDKSEQNKSAQVINETRTIKTSKNNSDINID